MSFKTHFSQMGIQYAASKGVPLPQLLVPIAGVLAIAGALSIITGFKAKWGAWLIVIFLMPVTFYMHAFWNETDQMMMQMQMANFMKNISLLGSALIISYFGSGALSVDGVIWHKIYEHRTATHKPIAHS
jgi:putative oxidoreductase